MKQEMVHVKVEILDLTEDDDEETPIKTEPYTSVTEVESYTSDSEPGETSVQNSPNERRIRNIEKCMDKAIAEIRKGQSLVIVASHYGIPQEILYNRLVSRSLPHESEILTPAEENSLVKWIVKSNRNNTLIFKQDLMEKVGKLKKIMNITPIFAKSKFGRKWYDYFMKSHPEVYENDRLIMLSDKFTNLSPSKNSPNKKRVSISNLEEILTQEEEDALVNWILFLNKSNSLVFKYQLLRKVGKMNKVSKLLPGFAKSKFGRKWYEKFLRNHPEIYENDGLLLTTEKMLKEKENTWSSEDGPVTNNTSMYLTDSVNMPKHPTAMLLSHGIKDAIVVLYDFRKDKNSPYRLNGKNIYMLQSTGSNVEIQQNPVKTELPQEYLDSVKIESSSDCHSTYESEVESERHSSTEGGLHETYRHFGNKGKQFDKSHNRPICKICAKSFSNFIKLKRHMLTIHQPKELRSLTCAHCSKRFVSKYHLGLHVQSHITTEHYKCDECGRPFKYFTSLRKHKRTIHEGLQKPVNIFFCDICEKGFKYKNSLEAHIIYGHFKEKKQFTCNICNKSFVKPSNLTRHKMRHSKIKHFKCSHCKKTYSRKYLLVEHLERCAVFDKVMRMSTK